MCVCVSVIFCLSSGGQTICLFHKDKHFRHTMGGTNLLHKQGGQTFLHMGDKHFIQRGGQSISVGGGGGDYDVDGDKDAEDVSEARKLSVVSRN